MRSLHSRKAIGGALLALALLLGAGADRTTLAGPLAVPLDGHPTFALGGQKIYYVHYTCGGRWAAKGPMTWYHATLTRDDYLRSGCRAYVGDKKGKSLEE